MQDDHCVCSERHLLERMQNHHRNYFRIPGALGGGKGGGTRSCSNTPRDLRGSADDGKRLSEYLQVRSCAVRFMMRKRDEIEKTRGRSRRGERLAVEVSFFRRRISNNMCFH